MFKIYTCLTAQHDLRLVGAAVVMCLFSSAVAVDLLRRIRSTRGRMRWAGVGLAATVSGVGVWATHFLAMLAFTPGAATSYHIGLTIASLAAAIGLIGCGFQVALGPRRIAPAFGGALVGAAVGVMHYLGMAAFRVAGVVLWDQGMIVWSLVLGVGLGIAAISVALRSKAKDLPIQVAATGLLAGAIAGLHFTGMAAAAILPDSSVDVLGSGLVGRSLHLWVAGAALTILALSVVARLMDSNQRSAEARRRHDLANTAVEGLVVCDDGVVSTANASFCDLAGAAEAELVGRPFAALFEDPQVARRLATGVAERFEAIMTAANKTGDVTPVPVELIIRMLPFEGRMLQGVAIRDLRARRDADAQIRFLAMHDPLTGLHNRTSFQERLDVELQRQRRKDDVFAVLCLDLDRFKMVNDSFGHPAGDAVLKAVAERIEALIEPDDVFARLGGDEFAIIRRAVAGPGDLADLAGRIVDSVGRPIETTGPLAMIGVSIGIAIYPADGQDAASLLSNADAALYRAKGDGRGLYRFFEPKIGADLRRHQLLEYDLRHAVARDELTVVYQPQVSLETGETFGFEALLRWNHPERGAVPPGEFIPVAEKSGLILSIGEWVLHQACAEAARWAKPLRVAVNVSGVQLHSPLLPGVVADALHQTGLDPRRLELEITETALIVDFDRAIAGLQAIKALGVQISMDDFGTGFSSLSNLRAFPFDKIKIDQSFIRDVHNNPQAATIVRAIVGLARGLNLAVLAEGVETREELAFLGAEMCTEAQGYLFGRPAEISQFDKLFLPPSPVIPLGPQRVRRSAEMRAPVPAAGR